MAELLPITGIAQNDSENGVIVSFDMPVTEIIVPLGTENEDIPLPETLAATLEEGTAVDIPVTWEDSGVYNKEAAGTYLFTADIGTWIYAQARPIAVVTVVPPGIHISGKLWLDKSGDGIRDADETGISGYPVTLYAEADLNTPVQITFTKADGGYRFEGMEPGSYVVRVTSETIGKTEYLLPHTITNDNKFEMDEDAVASWSVPLEIEEDAAVTGIDAGMRLPMGIMPFSEDAYNFFDIKKAISQALPGDSIDIVIQNNIVFPEDEELIIAKNINITFKTVDSENSLILTSEKQRHFTIASDINVELTFENVVLDGSGKGGGIGVAGSLKMTGAEITNCYAEFDGGGVTTNNSTGFPPSIFLSYCEIHNNTAGEMGGGVYAQNAQLIIDNCQIFDNTAKGNGGGGVSYIQSQGGSEFRIMESNIFENKSASRGGGILAVIAEDASITNSKISGNEGQDGSGIYIMTFGNSVATIDNSEIVHNTATQKGGGIFSMGLSATGSIVVKGGSKLEQNLAVDGGGIYADNSTVIINDSRISENTATNDGGGIFTTDLTKLFVSGEEVFSQNIAWISALPLPNVIEKYSSNIKTASNSVYGHPLNNYDINVLIIKVRYVYGDGTDVDELAPKEYAAVLKDPFALPSEEVPSVSDYVFTSWRVGDPDGERQDNTNVYLPEVTTNTDIYLVYERSIVTVSQKVSGDYADKTKYFQFTIYFKDSNGTPLPAGTEFRWTGVPDSEAETEGEAPYDETLILGEEGKATFALKHGQQISIVAVPRFNIEVVESENLNYNVFFANEKSEQTDGKWSTGLVVLDSDIRFDFTNTRNEIVPTGVLIENLQGPALLALSMLLLMAITSVGMIHSRRKRGL